MLSGVDQNFQGIRWALAVLIKRRLEAFLSLYLNDESATTALPNLWSDLPTVTKGGVDEIGHAAALSSAPRATILSASAAAAARCPRPATRASWGSKAL
jgi:hypothetical protein